MHARQELLFEISQLTQLLKCCVAIVPILIYEKKKNIFMGIPVIWADFSFLLWFAIQFMIM